MIINPYNFNVFQNNAENMSTDKEDDIIKEISEYVLNNFQTYVENNKKDAIKIEIRKAVECKYKILDIQKQDNVIQGIIDKIFGYGILQKYIDNFDISDIRVVSYDNIYVKSKGTWKKVSDSFRSSEEFKEYIKFCAMKNNSVINNEKPICVFSDRLNALRLEAGISPANVDNPSLVIRIHRKELNMTLEELFVKYGMMDANMYKYITDEIKNHKSFIICGKGGSGKTTLLKAILLALPKEIAITTSEETAELFITGRNVISRECILERRHERQIDLEKLTRHSLVMSNDVLVLGELKRCRGKCVF